MCFPHSCEYRPVLTFSVLSLGSAPPGATESRGSLGRPCFAVCGSWAPNWGPQAAGLFVWSTASSGFPSLSLAQLSRTDSAAPPQGSSVPAVSWKPHEAVGSLRRTCHSSLYCPGLFSSAFVPVISGSQRSGDGHLFPERLLVS